MTVTPNNNPQQPQKKTITVQPQHKITKRLKPKPYDTPTICRMQICIYYTFYNTLQYDAFCNTIQTILYYTILYYIIVQYNTILLYIILHNTTLYSTIQCSTLQYIQYFLYFSTTQHILQYTTMRCHTMQLKNYIIQSRIRSTAQDHYTKQHNVICSAIPTTIHTTYNTNTTEHHTTQHNTPQDNTILQYNTNSYRDAYYNACYETRYTASKKYVLQYALRYILQ